MGAEPGSLERFRERQRQLIERLRRGGVRDLAVLQAFDQVPRHLFVPEVFWARAYADEALPIGRGQTISRPSTHALYLEALELRGRERLLEIGAGSGFQTALLAVLCEHVYAIERVAELAVAARNRIESLGFTNVAIRVGDGAYGWRAYAPFDAIIVTAGAREVPKPLIQQLSPGGRLLIPIGDSESQDLHRFTRAAGAGGEGEGEGGEGETLVDEVIAKVRFVALRGRAGLEGFSESISRR